MRAIGGELDALAERIEAPAIAVEVRVWHELRVPYKRTLSRAPYPVSLRAEQ